MRLEHCAKGHPLVDRDLKVNHVFHGSDIAIDSPYILTECAQRLFCSERKHPAGCRAEPRPSGPPRAIRQCRMIGCLEMPPAFVEAVIGDGSCQDEGDVCPAMVIELSGGIKMVVSASAPANLVAAALTALR